MGSVRRKRNEVFDVEVQATTQRKDSIAPMGFITQIITLLRSSEKYESVTRVVPAEADGELADRARKLSRQVEGIEGVYIFTGDSDLVVYDLGRCANAEGKDNGAKVVFLRDVEFTSLPLPVTQSGSMVEMSSCVEESEREKRMMFLEYCPSSIVQRLGVQDMLGIAYVLKRDYHRTMLEAAVMVTKEYPSGSRFEEFANIYRGKTSTPLERSLTTIPPDKSCLVKRDTIMEYLATVPETRTVELMLQVCLPLNKSMLGSKDANSRARTIKTVLPMLIDDPARTSAWQSSVSIRRLLYTLLTIMDESIGEIYEYGRHGEKVNNVPYLFQDIKASELIEGFEEDSLHLINLIVKSLSMVNTSSNCLTGLETSRAVMLGILIHLRLGRNSRKSGLGVLLDIDVMKVLIAPWPASQGLLGLKAKNIVNTLTWSFLHIKAELMGVIYFLNLLKEVVDILYLVRDTLEVKDWFIPQLESLRNPLQEILTNVHDIYDIQDERYVLDKTGESSAGYSQALDDIVSCFLKAGDDKVVRKDKPMTSSKSRNEKENAVSSTSSKNKTKPLQKNRFDVLNDAGDSDEN